MHASSRDSPASTTTSEIRHMRSEQGTHRVGCILKRARADWWQQPVSEWPRQPSDVLPHCRRATKLYASQRMQTPSNRCMQGQIRQTSVTATQSVSAQGQCDSVADIFHAIWRGQHVFAARCPPPLQVKPRALARAIAVHVLPHDCQQQHTTGSVRVPATCILAYFQIKLPDQLPGGSCPWGASWHAPVPTQAAECCRTHPSAWATAAHFGSRFCVSCTSPCIEHRTYPQPSPTLLIGVQADTERAIDGHADSRDGLQVLRLRQ